MKTFAIPSLLALLLTAFTVAPASAQNNRQATFGNLIAALNNINVQLDNVEIIDDITIGDITLVDASNLLRNSNIRAFNNALNRNNVEILTLQDILNDSEFLNNNTILTDFLNNNDVNIGQILAIEVDVLSGDLTIFFL